MVPVRVFIGVDVRQPLGYTVCQSSIVRNSSVPVAITPLLIDQLPIKRRGLTDFTFSRFLVPYLCDYKGPALFVDADILFTGDVADLFALADGNAVQVHKHEKRFEWPAVMLFDCGQCGALTPEYIERADPFSFDWAAGIGDLPAEWHHLVGYDDPKPAKLLHYTMGVPEWGEVRHLGYSGEWLREKAMATMSCSWLELMGKSVHAEHILRKHLDGA